MHGRLTELGEVPQRAYKLALAVAMGKDVDSVVVDNEKVRRAQGCRGAGSKGKTSAPERVLRGSA